MRCILVGNYGVGNVGDEALRAYFLESFPEVQWTVLSAHPQDSELPRLPAGIRSFLMTPWWKTVRAIRHTDALVFGGGSLFTDVESSFACFLWALHAGVARFFGVPYFLAFQGIGPFRTKHGRWISLWVLQHARYVSVRDPESADRIESISMDTKCIRTSDPVVLIIQKKNIDRSKNVINFIPRHNSGAAFIAAASECVVLHPDADITILLLQSDKKKEQDIAHTLQTLFQGKAVVHSVRTLQELCAFVEESSVILTERYHGALVALALERPVQIISQAEGDKLSTLKPYASGIESFQDIRLLASKGQDSLRSALAAMSSAKNPVYSTLMNTLFLTATERAQYDALPSDIRDGWNVSDEILTYADTAQKQIMRLSLVRLHDPSLVELRRKMSETKTQEDMLALVASMDVRLVNEDDLAELFFAIGPSMLSQLIQLLLSRVQSDKDMEGVTAISVIRHTILVSLHIPS
jgi:polysaccharide pyruvyl transferase CsaB